jgi:signal transduction histidine kinase
MAIMLPEGKPRGVVGEIALIRADSTGKERRSEGKRPCWKLGVSGGGLGLPVCCGIAQGRGGRIRVESRQGRGGRLKVESVPGRGSTFSVILPCAAT